MRPKLLFGSLALSALLAVTGLGQIQLTPESSQKIGRKIWQNECGGTVEGLTSWNKGETFPSLGIGHFIWYPKGQEGPFQESFPPLIAFMKEKGAAVPAWLNATSDSPWNTITEFNAAKSGAQMKELRTFLAGTIDLQTAFIVQRLQNALPKMKEEAKFRDKARLERNFYAVAQSPQGVYALIDYVNFKGEGTNPNERYKNQGWGLAQVLLEMKGERKGAAAATEFAEAAKRVLARRVKNAPRNESQWLAGWNNRCETYKTPL